MNPIVKEVIREDVSRVLKGLVVYTLLIIILIIVKTFINKLLVLLVFVFLRHLFHFLKQRRKGVGEFGGFVKRSLTSLLLVGVGFTLLEFLFRLLGVFFSSTIIIILTLLLIVFLRRKQYVKTRKTVEKMIFGKPLSEFSKEEIKNMKFKIKW